MQSVAEWTQASGFPTFTVAFERSEGLRFPPYLILLSPHQEEESRIALRVVRRAVQESPNATAEVVALFADFNWRPQLVGAVAMLFGVVDGQTLNALWSAFDSGSWVSPQLAVTAFRCDPDFEREARLRIESGCPLNRDRLENMDWAARHSAAGSISLNSQSSKALASLVTVCRTLPQTASWLEMALVDEAVQKVLQGGTDGAAGVVTFWRNAIEKLLGEQNGLNSEK